MDNPTKDKEFLTVIFNHILHISRGECLIEDVDLHKIETDPEKLNILSGLKLLYEDIELYKTEYKQQVEAEYRLKVLKKKNEELEQFNYMASHDLKEPVRNIKNYSELILNKYDTYSDEKIKSHLQYINMATNRIYHLLSEILTYSTAGVVLDTEPIDLNTLIKQLTIDLDSLISKVDPEIQYSHLPTITADKSSIHSIFQNLISNAIKFRDPKRKLVISISHKSCENKDAFCISDNGIGIEEKYNTQIFDLLKRLHSREEIEGTGVGLSICKKLVEVHGGRIWVESVYGEGSKFYFTIPKTLEPEPILTESF